MKVHHALPDGDAEYRAERAVHPLVVAIGFFDGFHLGHRAIVRELLRARRPGERAAVVTFRDHPATFLRPGEEPPLIMTLEERINSFARAGVDETFVLHFDASIAALDPQAFLDETLVARIGAQAMIVGENFRFGAQRAGDIAFAELHLTRRGLRFIAVPNERDAGEHARACGNRGRRSGYGGSAAGRFVQRARPRRARLRARPRPGFSHREHRRAGAEDAAPRRRLYGHGTARRT